MSHRNPAYSKGTMPGLSVDAGAMRPGEQEANQDFIRAHVKDEAWLAERDARVDAMAAKVHARIKHTERPSDEVYKAIRDKAFAHVPEGADLRTMGPAWWEAFYKKWGGLYTSAKTFRMAMLVVRPE